MPIVPTQQSPIINHPESVENRDNVRKLMPRQIRHLLIRVGRISSLNLYEITDYELENLSRNFPSGTYLNCAIFLLSTATSFLIALLTTSVPSIHTFTMFVVVAVAGYTVGLVLLLLWWCSKKSTSSTVHRIRNRIPPGGNSGQFWGHL